MKRGIIFHFIVFYSALNVRSQVNVSFINYLSSKELKREHVAYIKNISPFTTIDSSSYFRGKFFLQYKQPELFLQQYPSGISLFKSDTSALNSAGFLLMRNPEKLSKGWFESPALPKESYYQRSMKNFYDAMANPVKADNSAVPKKLLGEFSEYQKYYKRKPFVAGALSAVVPGLGKLYAGRKKSFTTVLVSHVLFAARTIESVKVLGIKNPWTIFNLGFSGAFYFSNIYGSYSDMKKVKKERKTQLLIHAADYYNFNCDCSDENKKQPKAEPKVITADQDLLALEEKIFVMQKDSANPEEKNDLFIKKMDLCIKNYDFSEAALNEASRVDQSKIKDTATLKRFLWNAALLAHLNGNYYRAASYMNNYFLADKDSSAEEVLLSVLINNGTDTARVSKEINFLKKKDTSVSCLSCLNEVIKYERKGKRGFVIASRIIPGLGSMLNGNVFKGSVSLIIIAGIGVGIYSLAVNHLYINAFLWGFPTTMKFYNGQVRLTKKLFDKKELKKKNKLATKCELELNKILKNYPLNFR